MFSFTEEQHESNRRREGLLLAITAVFVFTNAVAFSLAWQGALRWPHRWGPLVWLGFTIAGYALLTRRKPAHDPYLLPLIALLTGWGVVLVDRLAGGFAGNFPARQALWVGLSTAVLIAVALLPPTLAPLRRYRYTLLIGGLLLLAITLLLGVNPSGGGARLWLPIPLPFVATTAYFQPSELLKLLLVIFLASYFAEREPLLRLGSERGLLAALPYLAPLLLMWGFCLVLLVWQSDLGAATIFFVLFVTLLYLATGDGRYVLAGLALLLLGGVLGYFLFDKVALRVDAWWNPWPDASGRAYQIVQSLYALAAGGLLGQGIGQGYPDYIPVVHSDFVFAAIAEEYGLVGSLGVVACFALLAQRGMRIALLAQRPFHTYLAAGITILLSLQALLIMGGVTRLLPLTGVTLPFVSYGGSSLLINCVMAGLLLYVSGEEGRGARSEGARSEGARSG